jgi:phosphatidylethanolamine-binding protein (PEBP) family uncharacterized protein
MIDIRTCANLPGLNYKSSFGFKAPCPPRGAARAARYVVHVYALDADLRMAPGKRWARLEDEVRKHVIAEGSDSVYASR